MRVFKAKVTRVVDGDTVEFSFTQKPSFELPKKVFKKRAIRFWGMDTPETNFYRQSQSETAVRAKKHLMKLLKKDDPIEILTATDVCDAYGRVLGWVFKNGKDINLRMVKDGWAVMYQLYPNLQNFEDYRTAFINAIQKKRGLFKKGLNFEFPFEFRRRIKREPFTRYVADYSKGYYFFPNEYLLVAPENRIFFSSEAEARKSGFVKRRKDMVRRFYRIRRVL